MSRYRGTHRGRHARPSEGPLAQALGVVRRPAVTAGMALALVGTGAVGVGTNDAVADSEPFTLSAASVTQAALLAKESFADDSRISNERAGANAQRAALDAKAQAEAKAKADAAAAIAKAKADAAAKVAKAKEAALTKARVAAAQKAARDKQRASLIAGAQADPRSAARALMGDYGFSSDRQWDCLNLLWEGESAWNFKAENPSSGAYGIPQSLPARKMATEGADYRTNPVTQIKWGLNYIKQSYGTPCGAWEFWNNRFPHWY
ncbi:transglycosylase SLT domain-containing protein [Knoellia sp. S7-12]|uniref:aggregation-promoting factor C-terminal-like domain-containing protein n=1 Tax=Knoellia sp. S7-12 TaxID=3126698 RepID=UPI003367E136